jgi:hypothetical protein
MRKALAWFLGVLLALAVLLGLLARHSQSAGDVTNFISVALGPVVIFASIFGVALGNASREPARVMWVLPLERWRAAVSIIAVDAVALIVAYAGMIAIVFACLWLQTLVGGQINITWQLDWRFVLESLCFVYAVYGWCALVGMIGRRVAYFGIASSAILTLWGAFAESSGSLGWLLRSIIVANPFSVFNSGNQLRAFAKGVRHWGTHDPVTQSLIWMGSTWEIPMLIAIALATCAIAVWLWQRSEVLSV